MRIELFLTPAPLTKKNLNNKVVVAIDVLRCSTSICVALASGAKGVIPTADTERAIEIRNQIGADTTLLAGERKGKKIEDFQLGNSPLEFRPEIVSGKLIIMSTTNGSGIYPLAEKSALCLTGSLVNISALCKKLKNYKQDITLVCAGSDGGFSIEDTICGGMIIHKLLNDTNQKNELNDAASLALMLYRQHESNLEEQIKEGEHALYLKSIGFEEDIKIATAVDSIPTVPVLQNGRLISESVLDHGVGV